MERTGNLRRLLPIYFFIIGGFIMCACFLSRSVTTAAESAPLLNRRCVIIDAGHGGIDGGATSCTGVLESKLNLDVAMRTNDLLHLLGVHTKMTRTEDISIYRTGDTIAAKKMSDLKERVRIVNKTSDGVLISIHMNQFAQTQYHGPQVFYAATDNSKALAEKMQTALRECLDPDSNRNIKNADGIYLMEHINAPGILIECGFLSNPAEEAKLRDPLYQKQLSCILAVTAASFLHGT